MYDPNMTLKSSINYIEKRTENNVLMMRFAVSCSIIVL